MLQTTQPRYLYSRSNVVGIPSAGDTAPSRDRLHAVARSGHVHFAATSFIRSLSQAHETIVRYSRIVGNFHAVLDNASGGKAIDISDVNDDFLRRWKKYLVEDNNVTETSFSTKLFVVLSYLLHAQETGWIPAGTVSDSATAKVKISWKNDNRPVHALQSHSANPDATLVSDKDFQRLDAEVSRQAKGEFTKLTRLKLNKVMKRLAFRRSEVVRLSIDDIPSMRALVGQQREVALGRAKPVVRFQILSSKRGGLRNCRLPLTLAIELREYIDGPRRKFLAQRRRRSPEVRNVFISQKSGRALTPQSITNFWKLAAAAAARRHGLPDLALIRPHHSRHRGITDFVKGILISGRGAGRALLLVGSFARLRRYSTLSGYLHVAEADLPEDESERSSVDNEDMAILEVMMSEETTWTP